MKLVTLVLGAVVLAILASRFEDIRIASEGKLLTKLSIVLLGLSSIATLLRSIESVGWEKRLWLLISGAFIYLALDDSLLIHERIDKRIHKIFQIQETKLSDALDGVIVLLYGVASIVVIVVFRHVLKEYPGSFTYLGIAFFFLFAMIGLDLLEDVLHYNAYYEESCKVVSDYFFLLAFVMPSRKPDPLLNLPPT